VDDPCRTAHRSPFFMGNPKEAGALRIAGRGLPANWRVAPHTHPEDGRVTTVVSGVFYWARRREIRRSEIEGFRTGQCDHRIKGLASLRHDEGRGRGNPDDVHGAGRHAVHRAGQVSDEQGAWQFFHACGCVAHGCPGLQFSADPESQRTRACTRQHAGRGFATCQSLLRV